MSSGATHPQFLSFCVHLLAPVILFTQHLVNSNWMLSIYKTNAKGYGVDGAIHLSERKQSAQQCEVVFGIR